MEESKIEKRNQLAEEVLDSFQNLVLGFMPGGHIISEFLNFRSNLKQRRILNFSQSVKRALEDIQGRDIKIDTFTTEEFVDVFELIMNRIQNTKSEYKLEKFKNILIKQIVQPIDLFTTLNYIEMVNDMNEFQLHILDKFTKRGPDLLPVHNFAYLLTGKREHFSFQEAFLEIKIHETLMKLSKSEIEFFGNKLVSMGLVKEIISTGSHKSGTKMRTSAYKTYQITGIGRSFLEFIKGYEDLSI